MEVARIRETKNTLEVLSNCYVTIIAILLVLQITKLYQNQSIHGEISGCHGDEHEDDSLLG
jgi:hypothetical protein